MLGCVGTPTQHFCVSHVHFVLFVLISFALGNQRKPSLQWNNGFNGIINCVCAVVRLAQAVGCWTCNPMVRVQFPLTAAVGLALSFSPP